MSERKRRFRQKSETDKEEKKQRREAVDDDGSDTEEYNGGGSDTEEYSGGGSDIEEQSDTEHDNTGADMGKFDVGFDIVKTHSLSSCTFIFLMGEINGKTIGYISHSPVVYQQPFTPTTTTASLINDICYNINEYLDENPEFNGAQSSNITNINIVIGGGGVMKPDFFRDGFSLINKAQNNIHNHLTIFGSHELFQQIKHQLTILPPITFILSDEDENEGAVSKATVDPPDVQVVFDCHSKILSLTTYWKHHTFQIASMNINFNQIDKNFVWTLEKDKILAVQKKLEDDHQTLNAFNEVVEYVKRKLNTDPSTDPSTNFYSTYLPIQEINNDDDLHQKFTLAAGKLVMVYFFNISSSTSIIEHIQYLNDQYRHVIFMKADIKKFSKYSTDNIPMFVFFQFNQDKEIARVSSMEVIEQTLMKYSQCTRLDDIPYMNLNLFINGEHSMAINAIGEWKSLIFDTKSNDIFGSNNNSPELIIHITFNQAVTIYSVAIGISEDNEDNAPKTVKLFINRPTIDLNDAKTSEAVQILEFQNKHIQYELPMELLYNKFQNIHSLSLFFTNNQSDSNQTIFESITFFGVTN